MLYAYYIISLSQVHVNIMHGMNLLPTPQVGPSLSFQTYSITVITHHALRGGGGLLWAYSRICIQEYVPFLPT
jgi:hypothetical protein